MSLNITDVTTSFYENNVPQFVELELVRLYGNIFSTVLQFGISGELPAGISTYVASCDQQIVALFLYCRRGRMVQVLNEVIHIGQADLQLFADAIFAHYPAAQVISFKATETDMRHLSFPTQHFNQLEDIAMRLPDSPEDYLASLGKNTRRNIKRYSDRLVRSFPSFRHEIYIGEEVSEQHVREIIEFNRARMANKNKVSTHDENEVRRVTRLVKACGLMGIVTIDGRACAGAISYRVGSNYFLDILAHDPQYDDYWIGILCCYMTICECIARGGREFHFLWGRYDYKFTLGAKVRDLDCITIYRSRLHMLLNADIAVKIGYAGYLRRLKLWMQDEEVRRESLVARVAHDVANRVKQMKRMMLRPRTDARS